MFTDHVITNSDCREICNYCGQKLEKWNSSFIGSKHYKSVVCGCGKNHSFTVNFDGSGHDIIGNTVSFTKESEIPKIKTLEAKIREIKK